MRTNLLEWNSSCHVYWSCQEVHRSLEAAMLIIKPELTVFDCPAHEQSVQSNGTVDSPVF